MNRQRLISVMFLCAVLSAIAADGARAAKQPAVYPVAVLPFTERGAEVKDMGGKVTDLLYTGLLAQPGLFLVDREDLNKVIAEQELNLSGLANPAEATQVGQLTGAKLIVTGSVLQVDNSLIVVAKIIGTETSRVVGTSVKGSERDDLTELMKDLSEQVTATIQQRADTLVARPVSRDDRIAGLKKELDKSRRPTVFVSIKEEHVGRTTIDPAAETELTLFTTETGFDVIDPEEGSKSDADVLIVGEGMSEFATRHGNLISVKARLEVKAVDRESGEVIAIDRQTSVAVGLTERVAGKSALQMAAADIADRLLPKIVEPVEPKKSGNKKRSK